MREKSADALIFKKLANGMQDANFHLQKNVLLSEYICAEYRQHKTT
jgi:hypothetical protein